MNNKSVFAENLKHYMKVNNKKRKQVCDELGFSYYTFSDWVNGKKYPRMDKVEILAKYFQIKKSDLIESKDIDTSKHNKNITIAEFASEFGVGRELLETSFTAFDYWRSKVGVFDFTEEELQQLTNFANYLLSQRKDKK